MATSITVEVDLAYTNTDFKRTYKMAGVETSALPNIKSKVVAYNVNIPAADKKIFISDDYDDTDSENVIGELQKISAVRAVVTTENKIV